VDWQNALKIKRRSQLEKQFLLPLANREAKDKPMRFILTVYSPYQKPEFNNMNFLNALAVQ